MPVAARVGEQTGPPRAAASKARGYLDGRALAGCSVRAGQRGVYRIYGQIAR